MFTSAFGVASGLTLFTSMYQNTVFPRLSRLTVLFSGLLDSRRVEQAPLSGHPGTLNEA